ncbi:Gfo/Idh/MocA family protein [Vibrio viridaestus]|uniref:Gfo/Idh/MocA family oxidoreductase n=1 Tax=Vibrio viridaestus TaxID=2487322 RepID=A0A3N9TKG6_9VIBR|nr:Gfo/Idh/MocA family oxidoreductase [Vibrio viridaestus]RQW64839.1 gfo/Idh/MocA family oxidoreductase [Vibrio viridaestus]
MINGEKVTTHPIRWAMVGGGKGSNIGYMHRSAASRDNMFQLIAGAFDINAERGKEFGTMLGVDEDRCYPDYQSMFAAEAKRPDGIEAVSIATPNGTHYEICKAALNAGLHVVCEKPLCFSNEQADELVELAQSKNRIVGVTYGYSGHQMIHQAREMIVNGDLGKVRLVKMQFAHGGFNTAIEKDIPGAKWRLDPKFAGPSFILGDVGTHVFFLGETIVPNFKVEKLLCAAQAFVEGRQLEDNAEVMMKCNDGIFASLWASGINCGAQHGHIIRVIGEKASIEWWDEQPNQLKYEVAGKPVQLLERGADYLYDNALVDDRIGGGHAEGLFESWANLYRRFAIAMDATDKDDQATLNSLWYPGVKDGAMGVKFVNTCIESADKGAVWVDFQQ